MWAMFAVVWATPPGRWYPVDDAWTKDQVEALEALGYAQHGDTRPSAAGVTVRKPRAYPGLNLYSSGHRPEAVLLDMDGTVLHRWHLPFAEAFPSLKALDGTAAANSWRRVALLPDGGLIGIHDGIGMVRLDRDSDVVWALANGAHHDLEVLPDGRIVVLTRVERSEPSVLEDRVTTLAADGRELGSTSVLGALRASPWAHHLTRVPTEVGKDWLHTNTLHRLDGRSAAYHAAWTDGHLLLVARHLNLLMVLDPATQRLTWVGTGPWVYPHDAEIGGSGRVWLFDNRGGDADGSRAIALDPSHPDRVVWSWDDGGRLRSPVLGAVQELPNGNVLITESTTGRAVEVTSAGEVVWEFRNPETHDGYVAVVFEMLRLPKDAWPPR